MKEQNKAASVRVFKPRAHQLIAQIRLLAANTSNVIWTDHAIDQMEERCLTKLDALRVLRLGEIKGEIEPGDSPGEWKCLVTFRSKGTREIGVVTIEIEQKDLVIKTVMWVDE